MTKGTFVVVALAGLVGVASADDKKDAKAMDMSPPAELAKMAKDMSGTWKCTGNAMGMDGKSAPMNATMTTTSEMGGWWVHDSFDTKMGNQPFHFDSYTTYDAKAKKFHRVMMEIGGGYSSGDASAPTANKMDFDLTSHSAMGDSMFKDHADWSDAKVGVKASGEMSMDKGKTWQKVYDMTCKK